MAGYVYNQTTIDIDNGGVGSYSTETNLFTVASGKIYILKGIRVEGYILADTAETGAISFQISNVGQTHWNTLTTPIDVAAGGSAVGNTFRAEWCMPVDMVVSALPASTPITGGVDAGDAVDVVPNRYQSSIGANMKFYPGQILKFSPLDAAGAGFNASVLDVDLAVYAWWIEHTL